VHSIELCMSNFLFGGHYKETITLQVALKHKMKSTRPIYSVDSTYLGSFDLLEGRTKELMYDVHTIITSLVGHKALALAHSPLAPLELFRLRVFILLQPRGHAHFRALLCYSYIPT